MKTKQLFALAIVGMFAWFGASQFNNAQARYEQDVTDYQAVEDGDELPLQARVEHAMESPGLIELAHESKEAEDMDLSDLNLRKSSAALAETLLSKAFQYIGVPYRSGQSSPKGFDCSGFTSYVFRQMNIQLTRSSRTQYTEGQPVANITDLRKGDLVFFGGARGGSRSVGHVGIVTEVNPELRSFKFIHASRSAGIKVDDSKQAYYSHRYVGARRILN